MATRTRIRLSAAEEASRTVRPANVRKPQRPAESPVSQG